MAFASTLQPATLGTISELKLSIDELRKEITAKDSIISCLTAEVDTLKEENRNLSTSLVNCRDRLDLLETYTRVDNLIIKGNPERYVETAVTNASYDNMANNSQQQQQLQDENSDSTMRLVIYSVVIHLALIFSCQISLLLIACPKESMTKFDQSTFAFLTDLLEMQCTVHGESCTTETVMV